MLKRERKGLEQLCNKCLPPGTPMGHCWNQKPVQGQSCAQPCRWEQRWGHCTDQGGHTVWAGGAQSSPTPHTAHNAAPDRSHASACPAWGLGHTTLSRSPSACRGPRSGCQSSPSPAGSGGGTGGRTGTAPWHLSARQEEYWQRSGTGGAEIPGQGSRQGGEGTKPIM